MEPVSFPFLSSRTSREGGAKTGAETSVPFWDTEKDQLLCQLDNVIFGTTGTGSPRTSSFDVSKRCASSVPSRP